MSSAAPDEFALAGHRLEDRYEIERVVAAGGFGVVYYGHHRALRNAVAVKVLRMPPKLTEAEQQEFARYFLAEAQTIAKLQHPAVVRALDFGVSPMPNGVTAPWAVLEWVDGDTLKAFLAQRAGQRMRPREALDLLRPVFEALADAHALGIVHRDIKPPNIMLPKPGTHRLRARVLDFGVAKTMDATEAPTTSGMTHTRSQLTGFSVKYAAPEQVGGARTGPWTDVHALALVLVEVLLGRDAYEGPDHVDYAAAALRTERPTPAHFGVDAGAWEPVIARALAVKPPHRYANAREFLDALDADVPDALFDRGSAPTPRAAEPSRAGAGRTRALVLGAGILGLLVAATVAVGRRSESSVRHPSPADAASVLPPRADPTPMLPPASDAAMAAHALTPDAAPLDAAAREPTSHLQGPPPPRDRRVTRHRDPHVLPE